MLDNDKREIRLTTWIANTTPLQVLNNTVRPLREFWISLMVIRGVRFGSLDWLLVSRSVRWFGCGFVAMVQPVRVWSLRAVVVFQSRTLALVWCTSQFEWFRFLTVRIYDVCFPNHDLVA
jgi:hypothetical protein